MPGDDKVEYLVKVYVAKFQLLPIRSILSNVEIYLRHFQSKLIPFSDLGFLKCPNLICLLLP